MSDLTESPFEFLSLQAVPGSFCRLNTSPKAPQLNQPTTVAQAQFLQTHKDGILGAMSSSPSPGPAPELEASMSDPQATTPGVGHLSQYVTSHPGQLSLAVPP